MPEVMPTGFQRLTTTAFFLLSFLTAVLGIKNTAAGQDPQPSSEPPVVTRMQIAGNSLFSDLVLQQRLQTRPNRSFLSIPNATLWLWMYRLGEKGCCLHRRVAHTFMDLGEPPAYFDPTVLEADIDRLTAFYQQEGYRNAQVSADINYLNEGDEVQVVFQVAPGQPTYIHEVSYQGINDLKPEQRKRLLQQSLLQPQQLQTAPPGFTTRGQRYSEQRLLEERSRLMTFFRNEGYAQISRDSVRVVVYNKNKDSLDVTFQINAGQRFRFGDIHFVVSGPEPKASTREDTLLTPSQSRRHLLNSSSDSLPASSGWVTSKVSQERRLNPTVLTTALRFMPGDWYDQSRLLTTKRRLEGAGIFSFSDAVPLWAQANSAATVSATSDSTAKAAARLPHRIELRTRPRHRIRLESFLLQRTSVLPPQRRNELGAGIGTSYSNANLFGAAEILDLRLSGSLSSNLGDTGFLPTAQAELSAAITYPYLLGPLDRLDRALDLYDARSRLSLSFLTARRQEFTIRGRGTAQFRLELHHRPTVASFVDLLDLNLSDPRLDENIVDTLRARINDPFLLNRLFNDYNTPQINNATRYTLRSTTVNPLHRSRGYLYEGSVEVGGHLPYFFDRYVFTPSTLEGTLPGIPFFRRYTTGNRLLYHRYARLMAEVRRYEQLSQKTLLSWRLLGGVAYPLGRSNVVPFDRRFYAGGATSVRGWGLRHLGPGAVGSAQDGSAPFLRSGDVHLEGSLELRSQIIQNLLAANWQLALFTDVGNVWLGPKNPGPEAGRFRWNSFYKQQAVGAGVGLRFVWDYLVLRFDLAWKVRSPVPGQPLFPEGLTSPRRHFGIGHVF